MTDPDQQADPHDFATTGYLLDLLDRPLLAFTFPLKTVPKTMLKTVLKTVLKTGPTEPTSS
jgi:hypothetical protein